MKVHFHTMLILMCEQVLITHFVVVVEASNFFNNKNGAASDLMSDATLVMHTKQLTSRTDLF